MLLYSMSVLCFIFTSGNYTLRLPSVSCTDNFWSWFFGVLKPVTRRNFRVLTTLSPCHSTRFDVAFQQRMRTFVFKKFWRFFLSYRNRCPWQYITVLCYNLRVPFRTLVQSYNVGACVNFCHRNSQWYVNRWLRFITKHVKSFIEIASFPVRKTVMNVM
jgi:hypothetical protein